MTLSSTNVVAEFVSSLDGGDAESVWNVAAAASSFDQLRQHTAPSISQLHDVCQSLISQSQKEAAHFVDKAYVVAALKSKAPAKHLHVANKIICNWIGIDKKR